MPYKFPIEFSIEEIFCIWEFNVTAIFNYNTNWQLWYDWCLTRNDIHVSGIKKKSDVAGHLMGYSKNK